MTNCKHCGEIYVVSMPHICPKETPVKVSRKNCPICGVDILEHAELIAEVERLKEEVEEARQDATELVHQLAEAQAENKRLAYRLDDVYNELSKSKVSVEKAEADNAVLREVLEKVKMYIQSGYWQENVSPDLFIEQILEGK